MKKMLSLVLALALCLTAITAYAAVPSKIAGIISVFINDQKCSETPDAIALAASNVELLKLVQKGPAEYFGAEVNEVFEFSPVKVTVPQDAVADGKVEAVFVADTAFDAGENVLVLLAVEENNVLTWTIFEGIGNDAGGVVATVDAEILAKAIFCALAK